ncbi:helix-turn-helix domain-containing protein [Iocasia frigidifontis]|uniref:Helix-turn-helix domain-containing protein n=1 Tax=Iocasia fonsfrigidae TaxID=2682810 RepID=A0A8A7KEU3_9FIRM|nr:Uma2 family endonuclease [Iocasia fonsfrigidae]QTL96674.1 helix-turn-helix domain-containing protein [Iocasia fonsfrigidae]
MSEKKELITAQDVAESLDLSVETIWRYTREGKIPFIELGKKQYRYKLADVIKALTDPVVKESKADYKTGNQKNFTYQDYLKLPEEPGYQFEVLEGCLVKEPSPNVMHQRVSRRLQRILEDYFYKIDHDGEIFNAPLDVTFSNTTVVQPDLFYISANQNKIIKEKRIDGSPVLVVEIISPYNPRKDRLQKMRIYQKAKIKHYWLVNPEERTLECFALRNNAYTLLASGMDEDIVEHPDFQNLSIPLEKLWHKSSM